MRGVWLNGTQIFSSGIPLATKPTVGFGSKAVSQGGDTYTPGLTLFENLTYTRAFNRTEFSPSQPKTMP
ncbi:MAG: hypothetical protein KF754_16380, partial [Planctomycetes bacterium]|nr:hypothetical protein [Planctomycetota bacterium]